MHHCTCRIWSGRESNLYPVPQLQRCSRGTKFVSGGQHFWVGLVFTKFSVDLKKKGHRGHFGLLFSPSSLVDLQKKKPPSWNCRKRKGSLGWACWAVWEIGIFVWGGAAPFALPPPNSSPAHILESLNPTVLLLRPFLPYCGFGLPKVT